MRLIDADVLKEKAFGKRGGLIHAKDIDEMPTINPVAEALKILPEKETVNRNSYEYYKRLAEDRGKNVMSLAAALENALAERAWIPCSERLPDEEGEYLITDDSGGIKTIEVDSFMFFEDGTKDWCYSQNAIAWMTLPEPYKE